MAGCSTGHPRGRYLSALIPRIPLFLSALVIAQAAHGDIAVDVAPGAPDTIFPNAGTTHGWLFAVNASIEVTHLGLYDRQLDGFAIAHPVGLWDSEGTLLASVVMSAGAGDLLIDNFRYAEINPTEGGADPIGGEAVVLTPGMDYTIGFFSESFNQSDGMVIFDGFHTVNPIIEYAGFGLSDFTDGLEMPTTPDDFGLHRWGPNFQFELIPAPPAAALLLLGLGGLPRRRRAREADQRSRAVSTGRCGLSESSLTEADAAAGIPR